MDENTKKLQEDLKESAQKIWLAGLGALAAAGEEGGKLFDRLVDRGREYDARGRDEARKQYEGARTTANDLWDNWSGKLDEAVTKALQRIGVPSRDEIRNLTQRVEELNSKVEMLKPRTTPAGPIVTPEGDPITSGTPVTAGTTAPTLDPTDPSKIIA
jgi:poly(hydroxyalkanoate) granule-associated protein